MNISVKTVEGVDLVVVKEEQLGDDTLIMEAGNRLQEIALANETGKILLDIGPVKYVSSLMIGQLISLKKICSREKIDLKICNVSTVIMEVLKLVRFDKMIKIYDTRDDAFAAFEVGEHDTVIAQLDTEAITQMKTKADSGNSDFQFQLANCYEEGNGLEADPKLALQWYLAAAEQDHVESQYKVGMAYAYGIGAEQNFDEAIPWYTKAAEKGHSDAQYMVGLAFQHGLAGTSDNEQAVKWYKLAASQGHEKARDALNELAEASG